MSTPKINTPNGKPFKFGAFRVKQHAIGLLNMLYTSNELAEAFETDRRVILERWIGAGLPYTKDDHGRYWFSGREVEAWVKVVSARSEKRHVPEGTIWCNKCKKHVKPNDTRTGEKRRLTYLRATCPQCGRPIARVTGSKGAAW